MNRTALADAKANNIPPMASNEPMDRPILSKLPRNVWLASPNRMEVADVFSTKLIANAPVSPITFPTIHHPRRTIRSRKGPGSNRKDSGGDPIANYAQPAVVISE